MSNPPAQTLEQVAVGFPKSIGERGQLSRSLSTVMKAEILGESKIPAASE